MNRYQDIIGKANYWLFLAVVALLPFPQIALRYACVLWLVGWLLEGRWLKRPLSLRENKMAIPFLLFGLWYAWKLISGLWAADVAAWRWEMERYLTFGLLVPIGLWGVNANYDWRQAGKVLIISCIAAIPIYLATMGILYFHFDWCVQHIDEEWSQYGSWWRFLSENVSHLKHRLFLCSVEMFGAIMALELMNRKNRWLFIPAILLMLSAIPLTSSRQSILTCAALLVVAIIYSMPKRYRLRYGVGILLLGMVLGGGLLKLHPRMQNFELSHITEMREISYTHDIRFNIWGVALQTPGDYLAYGIGAGQSTNYMVAKYQDVGLEYYKEKHYHPHNQYLEELMEIGIPGLLLFLLAWLAIPFCAKEKGRETAILFTALFMMNMLTDCMFGKFCGIALWAVGMMFMLMQSRPQSHEEV